MSDQPPSAHRVPSSAATFGMWLFLAALFMLFASSLLGYVFIRLAARKNAQFPAGAIHLPTLLWLSTAAVIGVSVALSRGMRVFRGARQRAYRDALTAALALAVGFITVQAPALINLLIANSELRKSAAAVSATQPDRPAPAGTALYALIFFLVLVHALHVVGGIAGLLRLTVRAHRGTYDPSDVRPVKHVAMYWHFLDAVWLAMFLTFLVLR
jgi:heme/copper-type cytochrome/quinol oxidase subunit 3